MPPPQGHLTPGQMTDPEPHSEQAPNDLDGILDEIARLLPAQGPINIFVHHNTLHAFEHLPFEQAVVRAGQLLGCEPFLSEQAYREALSRGRINPADLRDAIQAALGPSGAHDVCGFSRAELAFTLCSAGLTELRGAALRWRLFELDTLERLRADVPPQARAALNATLGPDPSPDEEAAYVTALWHACVAAIERAGPAPTPAAAPLVRHRDALLNATGIDTDSWVQPPLIRLLAAYLDQGLALWPMSDRAQGMYAWFVQRYRPPLSGLLGGWALQLRRLLQAEGAAQRDARGSIEASLAALGVGPAERGAYLRETALALRGWAGMVRQVEQRPDRVPVSQVPAKLEDMLAICLLFERAAARAALDEAGLESLSLEQLRERLQPAHPPGASFEERAWLLFQLAQLQGLDTRAVEALGPRSVDALEAALREIDGLSRRRMLHVAYERHLSKRYLDALAGHSPEPGPEAALFQAVMCIDDREESIRRHIEEVEPRAETFGTAGFFAVPIYYKGPRDARPRPLAPIAITPRHFVGLKREQAHPLLDELSRIQAQTLHVGSRGFFRGALVSLMGALAIVPLIWRVLFPRLLARDPGAPYPHEPSELLVRRTSELPPMGEHFGFTLEEMADAVQRVLTDIGLNVNKLSPIFFVMGHASDSLNNPHRSAYDCGACGGGPGGANARAFALMANDAEVRALLAGRGLHIPAGTWFVAAQHNTTDDEFEWFDTDRVPEALVPLYQQARAVIREARRRNAQERCRRFAELEPLSPVAALREVQGRRMDLAQPRPEYNHATNALCFVGRRTRTRGLFLDRRAFLVSYDPKADDSALEVLRRTLAAVLPVAAGINLEYFFGTVDNTGYGSGTKLPHNVSALLGVMDGSSSDLRTGLWAQTVEIHEPVRLTLVVETQPERLRALLAENPALNRLFLNRWVFVATLDPDGQGVTELRAEGDVPYTPQGRPQRVEGPSIQWTRGKRGHLDFVEIQSQGGAAL